MVKYSLLGSVQFILLGIAFLFSGCFDCRDDDCPLDIIAIPLHFIDSLGNICSIEDHAKVDTIRKLTNANYEIEILRNNYRDNQLRLELSPEIKNDFTVVLNDSTSFTYTLSRDSFVDDKCCGSFTRKFSIIEERSSKMVCNTCEEMEIKVPSCP